MSKLGFHYKLLGLLLVVFLVSSCRKDLNHTPGTTISIEETGWKRISYSAIENLYALEVFNNRLYLGGAFYSDAGTAGVLFNYRSQDATFTPTLWGSLFSGGVFDLHIANNRLYIAGNHHHTHFGSDAISLNYINQGGSSINVGIANYQPFTIYSLNSFGDSLMITGVFQNNSFFAPDIQTQNVEFLQFDTPIGAADVTVPIHGSCMANGEIYICGEQGFFGYYSGSSFFAIEYPGKSSSDVIYDMTVIASKIYLLGKFQDSGILKSFDISSGTWNSPGSISTLEVLAHGARFTWIDNELYVCGNGLVNSAGVTTNIFKSNNGVSWKAVGDIQIPIRDIALYDGTFYAAGIDGLYRLND